MMFYLHILSFISTDNLATSFCEDDGLYKKNMRTDTFVMMVMVTGLLAKCYCFDSKGKKASHLIAMITYIVTNPPKCCTSKITHKLGIRGNRFELSSKQCPQTGLARNTFWTFHKIKTCICTFIYPCLFDKFAMLKIYLSIIHL